MSWFSPVKYELPPVLLVEDNKRQAELTAQVIRESGLYEVLVAHDGKEALDILALHERGFDFLSNAISCILLDWQMPNMSGDMFLRLLRQKEHKSPFKRHIPVIIITAYGDNHLRMLAEDSSLGMASAYILKPFEETELLQSLKRVVYDREAEIMRELLIEQRSRWLQEISRKSGRDN
jgi:CheY-like chemotaxis protein